MTLSTTQRRIVGALVAVWAIAVLLAIALLVLESQRTNALLCQQVTSHLCANVPPLPFDY